MPSFAYDLAITAYRTKFGDHEAEIGAVNLSFRRQCQTSARRGDLGMTLMYRNPLLSEEQIRVLLDYSVFELKAAEIKVLDYAVDLAEREFKIDVSWK